MAYREAGGGIQTGPKKLVEAIAKGGNEAYQKSVRGAGSWQQLAPGEIRDKVVETLKEALIGLAAPPVGDLLAG